MFEHVIAMLHDLIHDIMYLHVGLFLTKYIVITIEASGGSSSVSPKILKGDTNVGIINVFGVLLGL